MKQNREHSLASLLRLEGGYAERETEGGGAVNRGVTFTVFKAWRHLKGQVSVTWDDLKDMKREEAIEIYNEQFLRPIRFDEMPSGIDHLLLDGAVLGGPTGIIKILQEALGFPPEKCDGHFGLVTRWAAKHRVVPDLINRISDERLETYQTFRNWKVVAVPETGKTWGEIWTTRIATVRKEALALAGFVPSPVSMEPPKPKPTPGPSPGQSEPQKGPTLAKVPGPTLAEEARKDEPTPGPSPGQPEQPKKPILTPIRPSPYINKLGMDLLLEGWTKEGFQNYVEEVVSKKMGAWRPMGVVLHATYQPSLKDWDEDKVKRNITEAQRIANMVPQWQRSGFKASPHLFIDREEIWTATPLWKRGTHSPSYNPSYWGVELVGNYADKPGEKLPDEIKDNAVHAIACLYLMLGREPTTTNFRYHGEDPRTTHKRCPGHQVGSKAEWDKLIEERMVQLAPGEHYIQD